MTPFEYLVALVSIVVGLTIARTLAGILELVHNRDSISVDWLPIVWTGNLLMWTVWFWWITFGLVDEAATWEIRNLLFVLGYSASIFFVLGVLYPKHLGPGFDFREHFEANRRWFFGALFVLAMFDVTDTVYRIVNGLVVPPLFYAVGLGILVLGSAVSWQLQSRRFDAVFALVVAAFVASQIALAPGVIGAITP